jgi:hypothetical protein
VSFAPARVFFQIGQRTFLSRSCRSTTGPLPTTTRTRHHRTPPEFPRLPLLARRVIHSILTLGPPEPGHLIASIAVGRRATVPLRSGLRSTVTALGVRAAPHAGKPCWFWSWAVPVPRGLGLVPGPLLFTRFLFLNSFIHLNILEIHLNFQN